MSLRIEYKGFTELWIDFVLFEPDLLKSLCEEHGWQPREITGKGQYFLVADRAR